MAPQIATVAVRYGVPAEAIAGSLAQEQFDQTASSWNQAKALGSSLYAKEFLAKAYAIGLATTRLNGSDKALMASTMAAYLRRAVEEYQSNMSINGEPTTGIVAWNALNPDIQRALLVQYYKQGPTPDLVTANKRIAARSGIPYVPRIGADGAAATYLANQGAIIRTLADAPADFSDRWGATPESTSSGGAAPPISFPDVAQQAQRLATDRYFGNYTPGSGSEPNVSNGFARFESPRSDAAGPVPFLDSANAARRLFEVCTARAFAQFRHGKGPTQRLDRSDCSQRCQRPRGDQRHRLASRGLRSRLPRLVLMNPTHM